MAFPLISPQYPLSDTKGGILHFTYSPLVLQTANLQMSPFVLLPLLIPRDFLCASHFRTCPMQQLRIRPG
jgi:hypothetical protein